jgi:hypothetical protein
VYLGVFQHSYFKSHLFDLQPVLGASACSGALHEQAAASLPESVHKTLANAVNELYGRTFATWTLTTCALCLICAKNPHVRAIYGALCRSQLPTPLL